MNNLDENMISNILSIVLIVMLFILMILSVWYLALKIKLNKNKKTKQKKSDLIKNDNKKQYQTKKSTISNNYNIQPMTEFMEFDKIEDNMIVQKNGRRYLMVVQCQGVNYDLMSQVEKVSVEEGFQQFLNTLRHPVQIYIQTRTINLENSISTYKEKVKEIEQKFNNMKYEYNRMVESGVYSKEDLQKYSYEITKQRNLFEYGKDIVYNTEKMSLNRNVLNKQYYIIVPYYLEETPDENYGTEEIRSMAFSELYTKSQAIIATLSSCSVSGKILNSNELVDLLYVAYNRDESEVFGLERALMAGYDELYSTSQDVFEKKLRVLDQEIENRAIDLANQKIEKAKSKIAQKAQEKEEDMDSLISKMAELILSENKEYVGEEVAEIAIEEIKEDQKKKKGGNVDEKAKKSRRTKTTN